mgnify:CR=1 FL=1
MMRILFQGDSITDGGRLKDPEKRWDLNHQTGHCYVYPIVSYLNRKNPGKYQFINRGVSGESVDNLAVRWQRDTLDEHPDILSILVGINENGKRDGFYPEGLEAHLRQFDATYRSLLDAALAQNDQLKLIIMEPFFLPAEEKVKDHIRFIEAFAQKQQIVQRIAADYNAIFIPLQKELETLAEQNKTALLENNCPIDPREYWVWDGIHPTEACHGHIADLWLAAAKEFL